VYAEMHYLALDGRRHSLAFQLKAARNTWPRIAAAWCYGE
jgi:hypothetical protein